MAEERKPKIDLKARLGKASAGATPAAGSGAAIPVPVPDQPPPPVVPPPPMPGISGAGASPFGGGAPAIDPSNPLAAVAAPYRAPAPPPQPTRIEVDESTVQQARAGARTQGLMIAGVAALAAIVVGYVAGKASASGETRSKSIQDAAELAADLGTAKTKLQQLSEKLDAGRNALLKEHTFPTGLSKELGGINVDFDGGKLAGRRFSGFPIEVTSGLVDFITGVQALNDRKILVQGLLNRLEKPITEQLKGGSQVSVGYVAVLDKDPAGNNTALLAPLTAPITFTPPNITLPNEFNFSSPLNGSPTKLAAYKQGDVSHSPAAVYVTPKSFEKVCPSETSGQTAQLGAQLANMLRDINGEKAAANADYVTDSKPGLIERADRLSQGLQRVTK